MDSVHGNSGSSNQINHDISVGGFQKTSSAEGMNNSKTKSEKFKKISGLKDRISSLAVPSSKLKDRSVSSSSSKGSFINRTGFSSIFSRSKRSDIIPGSPANAKLSSLTASESDGLKRIQIYKENRDSIKKNLIDLKSEMEGVFGPDDSQFLNETLKPLIENLNNNYLEVDEQLENPTDFEIIENVALQTTQRIKQEINNYIDQHYDRELIESFEVYANTKQAAEQLEEMKHNLLNPSKAVGILQEMRKELAKEKLNETVSRINTEFDKLLGAMEELNASKATYAAHPEMAREIFKNVKVLQERSTDVMHIAEKQLLIKAKVDSIKNLSTAETKAHEEIKSKFIKIESLAESYYNKLVFTAQQKNEHKDLSIMSHWPRREHLMLFVKDILSGAQDLAKNLPEKGKDLFLDKVAELMLTSVTHENIGNGNTEETLSKDPKIWKEEQKLAKQAIQDSVINPLIEAYAQAISGKETPSEEDLKKAGKAVTAARDARINDIAKWGTAINRSFEIPGGPIYGQDKEIHVERSMYCLNKGYASSTFRGRKPGDDLIQPNLQAVEVAGVKYTSSATNVEFFQLNTSLRQEATMIQTAEILTKKIDRKLMEKGYSEQNSADNPLTVDVSTTLLLSPDIIRDSLEAKSPLLNMLIAKIVGHGIDASSNERQILKDSMGAWLAFSADMGNQENVAGVPINKIEEGKEFKFKAMDGATDHSLKMIRNRNGDRVFKYDNGSGKSWYVKFDISCYNVGVNKFAAKSAGSDLKEKLGGHHLSDEINEAAFKKDSARAEKQIARLNDSINSGIKSIQSPEILSKIRGVLAIIGRESQGFIAGEGLRNLRSQLREAETSYQTGLEKGFKESKLDELEQARDRAFSAWKTERQNLATKLFSEIEALKSKGRLSEEEKIYRAILEDTRKSEDLLDCKDDVETQLASKIFRTEEAMKKQMYSLSAALVTLGVELDADPHTGCRSGKDRTSLQRIECDTRFYLKQIYGRYLGFREIEQAPETKKIREALVLHSGHHDELAKLNIGGVGLNLGGAFGSYIKDIDEAGNIYDSWFEQIVLGGVNKVFERNLKYQSVN